MNIIHLRFGYLRFHENESSSIKNETILNRSERNSTGRSDERKIFRRKHKWFALSAIFLFAFHLSSALLDDASRRIRTEHGKAILKHSSAWLLPYWRHMCVSVWYTTTTKRNKIKSKCFVYHGIFVLLLIDGMAREHSDAFNIRHYTRKVREKERLWFGGSWKACFVFVSQCSECTSSHDYHPSSSNHKQNKTKTEKEKPYIWMCVGLHRVSDKLEKRKRKTERSCEHIAHTLRYNQNEHHRRIQCALVVVGGVRYGISRK